MHTGNRDRLLLFAKQPRPGHVKTRLGAKIGDERAAKLYRALLEDTCAWAAEGPFGLTIAFDPPGARAFFAELAPSAALLPQPNVPFGERLTTCFKHVFDAGAQRVVTIGADAPHIGPERIVEAFAALQEHPVVIGPACDGGYYLIGLRKPMPSLFENIDWSTEHVLDQTLALTGGREHLLAVDFDVDDPATLRRLEELIEQDRAKVCARTARVLESWRS